MKKIKYWIILVVLAYGFIELFSYGGLYLLYKLSNIEYGPIDTISSSHRNGINRLIEQKTQYISFSPVLGWSLKKNGSSKLYQANSSAIRSDREYTVTPPQGIRRVSSFGDSFTHGTEVKNDETWQAAMENYDSNIEVLNFGVGGFGLDQAYLRYLEEGRQYRSDIVLIGFMSENISRSVNTYRPFYNPRTGLPFTKPRFIVENGRLSLVPNPIIDIRDYKKLLLRPRKILSKIGLNDYYYQNHYKPNIFDWSPSVRLATIFAQEIRLRDHSGGIFLNRGYNENSEAYRVTKRTFDEFYNASIKNQSIPVILIFPNSGDLSLYRRKKLKRYSSFLMYFKSVGYRYIDLMGAFDNAEEGELFVGQHYSTLSNKLVARYILDYLNKMSSAEKILPTHGN